MARQSKTVNINGTDYVIADVSGAGRYSNKDREEALRQTLVLGRPLTKEEFNSMFMPTARSSSDALTNGYDSYLKTLNLNQETLGFSVGADGSIVESTNDLNPQEAAFNSYYRDLMRTDSGLGGKLYNAAVAQEQNAGRDAMLNASALMSQEAVSQAQTVKAITDQVRSERMARLRAGMSESQIANQDMQQLMSNISALNDRAVASNQAYLQGQQQYNNAQATAYNNWVQNISPLATAGSAYGASDAGDAYMQTLKRMTKTKENYNTASNKVTGGKQ